MRVGEARAGGEEFVCDECKSEGERGDKEGEVNGIGSARRGGVWGAVAAIVAMKTKIRRKIGYPGLIIGWERHGALFVGCA